MAESTPDFKPTSFSNNNTVTNNGVTNNTAYPSPGRDSSMKFYGTNYLKIDNAFDWHTDATMDFTIEMYVWHNQSTNDRTTIFRLVDATGSNNISILSLSRNYLTIDCTPSNLWESNSQYPLGISSNLELDYRGQWVRVAVIQHNSIIKYYINGVLYRSHNGHISKPLSECTFEIGRKMITINSNTIPYYWPGYINDVEISSVAKYQGDTLTWNWPTDEIITEEISINAPFVEIDLTSGVGSTASGSYDNRSSHNSYKAHDGNLYGTYWLSK